MIEESTAKEYPYSVKIEQTALGARVSVHVYNETKEFTIEEAVYLYSEARAALIRDGFRIAPEESVKRGGADSSK
jgi:hypothetical protein